MFKQLLTFLKKGDLVNQALKDTEIMLEKTSYLFNEVVDILIKKGSAEFDIYKTDREINSLEKQIRRKVLEHLSINPRQEIVASLVLTSIIIDIERIGDYSKNIYELVNLYVEGESILIDEKLKKDSAFLSEMFDEVRRCFLSGDESEALTIMHKLNPVKKGFENYIYDITSTVGRSTREVVINVLFTRYLKRVCAHLENVASSIANPFDMIGFYKGEQNKEAD